MIAKIRKAIEKETGLFVNYSYLINDNVRYEIEVGKDKRLEITMTRKGFKVLKKEMVKRHYDKGSIAGFGARIENAQKREVQTITSQHPFENNLCKTAIKIIKGAK